LTSKRVKAVKMKTVSPFQQKQGSKIKEQACVNYTENVSVKLQSLKKSDDYGDNYNCMSLNPP